MIQAAGLLGTLDFSDLGFATRVAWLSMMLASGTVTLAMTNFELHNIIDFLFSYYPIGANLNWTSSPRIGIVLLNDVVINGRFESVVFSNLMPIDKILYTHFSFQIHDVIEHMDIYFKDGVIPRGTDFYTSGYFNELYRYLTLLERMQHAFVYRSDYWIQYGMLKNLMMQYTLNVETSNNFILPDIELIALHFAQYDILEKMQAAVTNLPRFN